MRDRYRPWLAALLAFLFPGLGHAFLRKWGRAFLWIATIIVGGVLLQVLYGTVPADPNVGVVEYSESLPADVVLPILLLTLLSVLDAFLVARRQNAEKRSRRAAAAVAEARAGDAPERDEERTGRSERGNGAAANRAARRGGESSSVPLADAVPSGGETDAPETVQCPNCGKETDAEIDFCHWCTEPLPWADEE
ncbi:hypothetical protein GCM10027435_02180 [Haloparvum alkalitolerans]|uniref:TM2 domain-containing protein n=1 Tax=Haloparvum TaxID=1820337 RepID=UPI00071E6F6E|nr:TM2 domain-containing protein [Haloparvum sedimenti]